MATNPYNPPPNPALSTHHTVVIQQPVVVNQPTVRSTTSDFLGGIGKVLDNKASDLSKTLDSTANDFVKATVGVTRDAAIAAASNPLVFLKSGNVVQIVSKLCGKSLRILERGVVDCAGDAGTACQFEVVRTGPNLSAIKLRNMAQPQYHLAIIGGYVVGYGQGGPDCDFYPAATLDSHITLESCLIAGSHVGVLPSGQLTAPAQTSKQTDASHFKIKYVGTKK